MDLSQLAKSKYCTSFNADYWILENNGWTASVVKGRVQFGNRESKLGLQAQDWEEAADLLIKGEPPDEIIDGIEMVEL